MNRATVCRAACSALLVLAAVPSAFSEERLVHAYGQAIQTLLRGTFADNPGGMVIELLDEHGSSVFASGELDNGSDQKVDGDTIFELGSVTKVFTALLFLDAVRRSEMNVDDPGSATMPMVFYGILPEDYLEKPEAINNELKELVSFKLGKRVVWTATWGKATCGWRWRLILPSCSKAMHHESHEQCFIASSVKTKVRCEPAH